MLEEVYNSFRSLADEIGWKKYNINELFFKYIENENNELGEKFYAGIICRTWGYTGRVYLECNKHVPFERCYDILIDTINYVLSKRVWEDPKSSLYGDKTAPDKAFHIVLRREKSILLSSLNTYKRRSNFNTLSLDEIHDDYNDAAEGLFGISDSEINNDKWLFEYIDSKSNPIDKIILDRICFTEWKTLSSIAKSLKTLNIDDFKYFYNKYKFTKEEFSDLINKINSLNSKSLLKEIKKTLYIIKQELVR